MSDFSRQKSDIFRTFWPRTHPKNLIFSPKTAFLKCPIFHSLNNSPRSFPPTLTTDFSSSYVSKCPAPAAHPNPCHALQHWLPFFNFGYFCPPRPPPPQKTAPNQAFLAEP